MSKKKQPVGVAIDDVTIKGVDGLQLSINSDVIGTVMPLENGAFEAQIESERPVKVKSQDEGVEYLIQAYNLHH
ncbi:hypothetical protein FD04_GL002258 [Secundilactobacillus odoratitofui DSM 19909 = JCM 15043]|uniref:DUF2969 domain-containing protein n=1 Tax=Secundilactobacillus odoratitofui DSM 19909 = JCM 15043 TaxID=1423776 RepID=A0A0R1M2S5_9LACO|nr:DUF2969 family protein [Secundilactobacillus odoratitofui]KRK99441.1 hypothetical protein FD04_GL002258 [Secundilactobacillus odoratitofui DSM 19909 = JCM 15043]